MAKTTISVKDSTKKELDKTKVHPRETYNDVIDRLTKQSEEKP